MALQRYSQNGYDPPVYTGGLPKMNHHPAHMYSPRFPQWTYDEDPMRYIYALTYSRNEIEHHREQLHDEIEDWAVRCKELSVPYNPLQAEDLVYVFDHLLSYVLCAVSAGQDIEYHVGDELLQDIEQRAREDRYMAMFTNMTLTRKSQHYFRILAEISRRCCSEAVAEVLYYFLSCHASWIIEHNTTQSLEQWVRAVLISYMQPSEKRECIARLVEREPEIIDTMLLRQSDGVRPLDEEPYRLLQAVSTGRYLDNQDRSNDYWNNRSAYGYGSADRERDEHRMTLQQDIDHHKRQMQRKKQQLKDMDRRNGRSGNSLAYSRPSNFFRGWPGRNN